MKWGKCKVAEPLSPAWPPWDTQQPTKQLGPTVPSRVLLFHLSLNPVPREKLWGGGDSFRKTTVCSLNSSHRGLLCVDSQVQETEGKETFICPLSTLWALPSERHKWSVAGDGRAERERGSEAAP